MGVRSGEIGKANTSLTDVEGGIHVAKENVPDDPEVYSPRSGYSHIEEMKLQYALTTSVAAIPPIQSFPVPFSFPMLKLSGAMSNDRPPKVILTCGTLSHGIDHIPAPAVDEAFLAPGIDW